MARGKKRRVVRRRGGVGSAALVTAPEPPHKKRAYPPPVPAECWVLVTEFQDNLRRCQSPRSERALSVERYVDLFDEPPPKRAPTWQIKAAVGYQLQWIGFKENGCEERLSDRFKARRDACLEFDADRLDDRARGLYQLEEQTEMAKTKAENGPGRKGLDGKSGKYRSVAQMVIAILRRKKVGTNDEVVAEVQAEFEGTQFNEKHFAWYKNRFKHGKLSGQDGPEEFNQPDTGRVRGPRKKEGSAGDVPDAPKTRGKSKAAAKSGKNKGADDDDAGAAAPTKGKRKVVRRRAAAEAGAA